MSAERTGGSFLLQEQEAKSLVGIFVSTTAAQGPGWVWGAFGDEDPRTGTGAVTQVAFGKDVALRLGALLQVLVAQNMCLRGAPMELRLPEFPDGLASVTIDAGPGGKVFISWPTGADGVVWNDEGGQCEWGLREDRALGMSWAIISKLAESAAHAGTQT